MILECKGLWFSGLEKCSETLPFASTNYTNCVSDLVAFLVENRYTRILKYMHLTSILIYSNSTWFE